jgi:hypothetical protein
MNIWRFNAFSPQEPRGPSLPVVFAFHFVTLVHALLPLDLVMMQQFFTGPHDYGHSVKECSTKTTLSDDNSRDLTACSSRNSSPFENHFRIPFVIGQKSFPAPLFPPQVPHGLAWCRAPIFAVRGPVNSHLSPGTVNMFWLQGVNFTRSYDSFFVCNWRPVIGSSRGKRNEERLLMM